MNAKRARDHKAGPERIAYAALNETASQLDWNPNLT
jgi:hypothetical protein